MQQRNTTISIAKGIAIILMVMGHAECNGFVMSAVYTFHMPLFFITAGYFFSQKNVDNPWNFCVKRMKGLYVPFVKWSVLFLLLHNVFFYFGILNEQYGNWAGGVTHPYSVHAFVQRLTNIVFSMGGYDEFMAGAFWFFRALFVVSIAFLVLYKALDGRAKWLHGANVAWVICGLAIAFGIFKTYYGVKIQTLIQGGIRETMGLLFFGVGMLFHAYEPKIKKNWWLAVIYGALLLGAGYLHFRGMSLAFDLKDVFTLAATGTIGFLLVHYLSGILDKHENLVKRFLVHCGEMTIYIYVFHILSFKVVSLVKIWWYGLDFAQIGCHMTVHEHAGDGFEYLYAAAGVGLPLLWMWCYRCLKNRIAEKRLIANGIKNN